MTCDFGVLLRYVELYAGEDLVDLGNEDIWNR